MARASKKTRKNRLWLAAIVFFCTLAFVSGVYLKRQWEIDEARRVRYAAFGIPIPDGYSIHGIDVSSHQQFIDWENVRNMQIDSIHIAFAFMKATEGLNLKDKRFERNWKEAKKAGIIRGAYHFFLPTKSGRSQAQFYASVVNSETGDLWPVVDCENLYGVKPEKMRAELKAYITEIESRYGVKPIIYTYLNFYERYLGKEFDPYPLWIAHYLQPDKPRIERTWTFWQHSESGNVNGIKTKTDFNVFYGDSTAFKNLLIK